MPGNHILVYLGSLAQEKYNEGSFGSLKANASASLNQISMASMWVNCVFACPGDPALITVTLIYGDKLRQVRNTWLCDTYNMLAAFLTTVTIEDDVLPVMLGKWMLPFVIFITDQRTANSFSISDGSSSVLYKISVSPTYVSILSFVSHVYIRSNFMMYSNTAKCTTMNIFLHKTN